MAVTGRPRSFPKQFNSEWRAWPTYQDFVGIERSVSFSASSGPSLRSRQCCSRQRLCATASGQLTGQQAILPYQNQNLPFDVRARDLVSRMTLEEKVSQMNDVAPAIPRLGVPEYNWWNEALHGVARSGLATVFPQAIGMAATWDAPLMLQTATVISDEARAKHQEYLRHDSHQRYQGLTIWSPNINIFRDPRWGRGQETYGEDPFLTGTLAVQFIHGLQGDDPKYLKTVATVKHFAVHSGPEPERHTFDAVVSDRDLRETYLPHFEMGIRDGGAYSLMCAYNRIDGKAACGSDMLLKDILRGEWRFSGYVVSDCGAIDDIHRRHKVVSTAAEAAALGVKTGTDLDVRSSHPIRRAPTRRVARGGQARADHRDGDRHVGHSPHARAHEARHVRLGKPSEVGADSRSRCSTSRRIVRLRVRRHASRSCCSRTPAECCR